MSEELNQPENTKLRAGLGAVLEEIKAIAPAPVRPVLTTALFVLVCGALVGAVVTGIDTELLGLVSDLHSPDAPAFLRWSVSVLWLVSILNFVRLSRDHRGPGSDIAGVFNAASESEWGAQTPRERHNTRMSTVSLAVLIAVTVLTSWIWLA